MTKLIQDTVSAIVDFVPAAISNTELEFFSKNNITNSQSITLIAVYYFKKCNASQLAHRLHVKMPTVTGIVDRLVELGFVKRSRSQQDRRQVELELTQKGKNLIHGLQGVMGKVWEKMLASLTEKEIRDFRDILEKLNISARSNGYK